jgi:DNA-directed RNA polymerase II subunit RPB2
VIETPESEVIGYVKHNAITNIFSIARDVKDIGKIISKITSPSDGEERSKEDLKNPHLISLNGIAFVHGGLVQYGDSNMDRELIKLRRSGKLPHDVEISKDEKMKVIDVKCNSSRPLCPYLIIEDNKLVIEELNGWKWSIEKLIKSGCVEFLSSREEEKETNIICESPKEFRKKRKLIESSSDATAEYYQEIYNYTHSNIDPNQMFSVTGSICPFTNHQLAPRSIYQAGMAKQALGFYNINYHLRYSTTFKRLYKSVRPFSETMTYPIPVLDLFPTGQTCMVAFYCMSDNQEDAVIISEDFLNAKGFNFITYKTIKYSQPTQIAGAMEKFQRPPVRKNEDPSIYRNIEDNGYPRIDSYIRKGDCVLGKVLLKKDGTYNNSVYAQMDEEGFVEAVEVNRERDGQQILVKIRLRRYRKYQAGDKMALRYAQKGTVGRVVKREELLRVATGPNKGTYPHIVFNPLGFPSRQTVGLMIEGVENKAALYTGRRVNISSFQEYDREETERVLIENGLDPGGMEDMETSDGKRIPMKIGFVPLYEQALRHHVMDKIQMRDSGNKNLYTHQPIGGRTTGSGIRAGEMEKDAFIGHGASAVQVERLMKSSDEFAIAVCGHCGVFINNKICTACDKSDPVMIHIPYTFKLLIQLLNGVGIQIKLKTQKKSM